MRHKKEARPSHVHDLINGSQKRLALSGVEPLTRLIQDQKSGMLDRSPGQQHQPLP
jgi:hypothetical protein